MNQFNHLYNQLNNFSITHKRKFNPMGKISDLSVEETFNFAYNMSFGNIGRHKNIRSGGSKHRKNGEVFADAFQGKLAEFALFEFFNSKMINSSKPDLTEYKLGNWDINDLTVGSNSISVKSTKSFGNLLLLESEDYDKEGTYIHNKKIYDYTILLRLKPFCGEIMKKNRCLYCNEYNQAELKQIISPIKWTFDIPGYISNKDFVYIINKEFRIPKGSLLNKSTKIDASNYYVQAGDLRNINVLCKLLLK